MKILQENMKTRIRGSRASYGSRVYSDADYLSGIRPRGLKRRTINRMTPMTI